MNQSSRQRYKFIGEYLVEAGLITEAQVGVILADQTTTPMVFGEIIATRGWVKPQTIEYLVQKIIEPERRSLLSSDLSAGMARQQPRSVGNVNMNRSPNRSKQDPDPGVNWIG